MTDEERIATLETLVAELRSELDKLKRARSMKRTFACAVCGGNRLVHVRRMKIEENAFTQHDITLTHSSGGTKKAGPLEAFACRACGLVEWHVASFDGVMIDHVYVEEIVTPTDRPASSDPYR